MTYIVLNTQKYSTNHKSFLPCYNYQSLDSVLCISTQGLGKVLTYTEISRNAAIMSVNRKLWVCLEHHQLCITISENHITESKALALIWQSLTHCTCTSIWPLCSQDSHTYNIWLYCIFWYGWPYCFITNWCPFFFILYLGYYDDYFLQIISVYSLLTKVI